MAVSGETGRDVSFDHKQLERVQAMSVLPSIGCSMPHSSCCLIGAQKTEHLMYLDISSFMLEVCQKLSLSSGLSTT